MQMKRSIIDAAILNLAYQPGHLHVTQLGLVPSTVE